MSRTSAVFVSYGDGDLAQVVFHMVEQVGFLVAREGTLEALVSERLAGGTGDVMRLLRLAVFGRDAHPDGETSDDPLKERNQTFISFYCFDVLE